MILLLALRAALTIAELITASGSTMKLRSSLHGDPRKLGLR
jgi:hypothetical protein